MEGRKQVGSSSPSSSPTSSLASELLGTRETHPNSSPSSGIFGSIFGPPSNAKVVGKEFLHSESSKKREFSGEPWSNKSGIPAESCNPVISDDTRKTREGGSLTAPNNEMTSIYQEQRGQPCHLSSSIYYGGQENYSHPQNSQGSSMNSVFKKDPGENDSGTASRGNWWQGSLYY